jgi:hypothetical protein
MSDATGTATHVLLLQERGPAPQPWRRVLTGTFRELRTAADLLRLPPMGAKLAGVRIAENDTHLAGRTVWECVEGASVETETTGTEGADHGQA